MPSSPITYNTLSVVIPFYNEEEAAESVVRTAHKTLSESKYQFEIIAVQNGSRDRTAEILSELEKSLDRVKVVNIEVNQGVGYGILQGLDAATGDVMGYMPGDGQTAALDMVNIVQKMETEGTEVGQGVRTYRNDRLRRVIVSILFRTFVYSLFGRMSSDVNGHPKLFSRRIYQMLELCSKDYFIDTELIIKVARLGVKVTEMNVTFHPRQGGRSSVTLSTFAEFIVNLCIARFSPDDRWGVRALVKRDREQKRISR
jgi:polyisoprenyl-phosphate glycosyltransferase